LDVTHDKPGALAGELFLRVFAQELGPRAHESEELAGLLAGEPSERDSALLEDEGPFLLWTLLGCGAILSNTLDYADSRAAANHAYPRDGRWVAKSSLEIGERTFYRVVRACVAELHAEKPIERIVDLGCGAAGLLSDVVQSTGACGVGIDASRGACAAAEQLVRKRRLVTRIDIVHRDAIALVEDPSPVQGADLVMCNFLLHEFPPPQRTALLAAIVAAMAPGGRLLVCEAVPDGPDHAHPFARAFRLVHVLMGQTLAPTADWQEAFSAAGLQLVQMLDGKMPGTRTFVARKPQHRE
jgi:SAM-dependent methyltransferase